MKKLYLKNVNIVVTRAQTQASAFARKLRELGAKVLSCPTIRIVPPPSYAWLDRAIRRLADYDWIIFTSANGVDEFVKRHRKKAGRIELKHSLKTCAIGPATAKAMRAAGIKVSKVSKDYVAESILETVPEVKGKKILIPRAMEAREVLPQELVKRGAQVDVVPVYRTVIDRSGQGQFRKWLKRGKVDCITFTSSSTVKNFIAILTPKEKSEILGDARIKLASIGPITSQTLREIAREPDILAAKPTTRHLADAIARHYKERIGHENKQG